MASDPRRERGALGERIAARHLERRGYRILDRNFRTRYGELDLVAADPATLVFCEVKTRVAGGSRGPEQAIDAIGGRKRAQVRRMAAEWLCQTRARDERPPSLRFDAIGVTLAPGGALLALDHLEDAF